MVLGLFAGLLMVFRRAERKVPRNEPDYRYGVPGKDGDGDNGGEQQRDEVRKSA